MATSKFGSVEHLPSGRWRARYSAPDGRRRSATFRTKADARAWLSTVQADLVRRNWRAPEAGRRTVGEYAREYLARTNLRPSTLDLYRNAWERHLKETWDSQRVGDATPAHVRAWHTAKVKEGVGPTAIAHAYRLLRALFNVAIHDELIDANPCRLKKVATPPAQVKAKSFTIPEVNAIAQRMPARYRTLVFLLAFGGLRIGEATALTRGDFSKDCTRVTVDRAVLYRKKDGVSQFVVGPPKSSAGLRTVSLPASLAAEVRNHLATYAGPAAGDLAFPTSTGTYVGVQNFNKMFRRACKDAGIDQARVHWLRHTGATLAAATGASTKELMHRLGHSTPDAALIYQHAVRSRDDDIARALDGFISPRTAHAERSSDDD